MPSRAADVIRAETAVTLDGLFRERVKRTPDLVAYRYFDDKAAAWQAHTWAGMSAQVARWQAAMARDGLQPGDRIAIWLRNSPEWVMCDIAALSAGLVVVPLYTQDRADNIAYILGNAGCKLLLFEGREQWDALAEVRGQLSGVTRFLSLQAVGDPGEPRLQSVTAWLRAEGAPLASSSGPGTPRTEGNLPSVTFLPSTDIGAALATIVYTSGTTGRPKGVMLSHRNILTNAEAALTVLTTTPDDVFLSFLPLSHTFERTCGYYLTMMAGSETAYARSIQQLGEDLQTIRPTVLVSVPRIYERVWAAIRAKLDEGPPFRKKLFLLAVDVGYARFEHTQGRGPWKPSFLLWPVLDKLVASKVRARLGGRLKAALSGGAALAPEISRVFIGLGVTVLQGYGMTESAPIACANRPHDNVPASVGAPIPGVEVKVGENNALLIKGPNVMLGYWDNPEATRQILSPDGWLNSGDTARIDGAGHVYITGRLKEIIVTSTGEKIAPVDVESAILRDPLFEQVMLLGEGKPYLSAVAVLNAGEWQKLAAERGLPATPDSNDAVQKVLIDRMREQCRALPGYAAVRRVSVTLEPWTVENGLLTPTLKLKRAKVMEKFNAEIDQMYAGH